MFTLGLKHWIWRNRALPWAALFLVLSYLNFQMGGTNPASRIAGLRAISESHSLNIDRYPGYTEDWSRSPNGHYYPNKAPGGVLLGVPIFFMIDHVYNAITAPALHPLGQLPPLNELRLLPPPGLGELSIFVFFMQLLPFVSLVLYACREFGPALGRAGTHFFALAALFGNTAAIYMNTYFGHGLAAWLMLACLIAWLKRSYAASGACIAAALLTEYGTAFVIPFFLVATFLRERELRPLLRIALGSLPFAGLWIWYHQVAFGSPFALAIKFSNPKMIEDPGDNATVLWGMFGLPSPWRVWKLLFGPERGLLFTQPWLLATFPFFFLRTSLPKGTQLFLCGGLCGLFWMNASIGGWAGGWAVGPRYLSQLFPPIALAIALSWSRFSSPWRMLLWAGLAVGLAFRIAVLPVRVVAPPADLWLLFLNFYQHVPWDAPPYRNLWIELALTMAAVAWVIYRERATTAADAPCSVAAP